MMAPEDLPEGGRELRSWGLRGTPVKEQMEHKKASERALKLARRKFGMPGFPKEDVFRVAAEHAGRELPKSRAKGYALLRELTQQGEWKPNKIPKLPKVHKPHLVVPQQLATAEPSRKNRKHISDEFLATFEWRQLRMLVLKKRGARCECCGATPKDGVRMNVDHIKPRKLFPELALTESNLQVLCEVCNHGKGNWDQTDWRSA